MHPCFETILIEDYKPLHVKYHNERFWLTCKELYGVDCDLDLGSIIKPTIANCKCKIVYDGYSFNVQYTSLPLGRKFENFKVVSITQDYTYKCLKRDWLDSLRGSADEAILIKDGLLKDTTIANIALKIDGKWLTPKEPLLRGTTRQRLLDEGKIIPANLRVEDLKNSQNFAIMNALLGFLELKTYGIY
jgi:4-amino-4-deoxychorismate lyase